MTLRKLIANTTDDSSPSWTIQWTIFIAGWLKFWRRATPRRLANILTPCLRTSIKSKASTNSPSQSASLLCHSKSRYVAIMLAVALPLVCTSSVSAQTKKKKSARPRATACRAGCKPDTTAPVVVTSSPEDEAAEKELSELARNLRNAGPGAYEKLSALSAKHAAEVWGARAALALGYDDYQKNRDRKSTRLNSSHT